MMVKKKIKEIEIKLRKVERELRKKETLPKRLDTNIKKSTTEIIQILDNTLKEVIPKYLMKKEKTIDTSKTRKGLKLRFFGKKKK